MREAFTAPRLINTGDTDHPVSVDTAILNGYAPDEELYTYATWPRISKGDLRRLRGLDYVTIFSVITKKFLGDAIPDSIQTVSAVSAYMENDFKFDGDGSLQLTELPNGLLAVGLSDGPTASFKDMAMQPLARWMRYLQLQRGEPLTILLSTSGDTGPAALAAFAGQNNTNIVAMMPRDGVSPFQRAQMAKYASFQGAHVIEIDSDFSGINNMQMEADAVLDLNSVNSVNIGRIIAQIPYYVASYLKAIKFSNGRIGDPVDVSVPSGNFGNALSAIIAREMGLPIRNIIVATNENDTLARLFNDGVFELSKFQHTDSSAQDVRMPSNVWRYFSMLFNNDPEKIAGVYKQLMAVGQVAIAGAFGIDNFSVRERIFAKSVRAGERASAIRTVHENSNHEIIIDPHTANGVAAVHLLGAHDPDVPMLVMETAKPFKFEAAIMHILGILPPRPERFKGVEEEFGRRALIQIPNSRSLQLYLATSANARRKLHQD